jgi:formylglycine-generating enzyme required for sulfatase activity
MRPLIFLSYSRNDREAAMALRSALEQAGFRVFRDEDAIRIGDRWLARLEEALRQCSAFVVLLGRDGVQRWVGAEVHVALIRHLSPQDEAQRLPIYPLLLEEAHRESLPPFLTLFQFDSWSPAESLPNALIQAIQAGELRLDTEPAFEDCPFLGLSAFGRKDAKLFFGRRQETLEALTYLGDQQQAPPDELHQAGGTTYTRWLQIEGNSGSGKSSLVNAGMLPMIEQGSLWARTGFEQWRLLGPMMPGKDPINKLAETLEQGLINDPSRRDIATREERLRAKESELASTLKNFKQPGAAFLLVVDQFEELFTLAEEASRQQFEALLANALQDSECPLFLISTVRADFLDRFESLKSLQAIYNRQCKRYFLPLVTEQSLREIIEQPARLAGLDVSEITTAMLNDAQDELGALPLVENALLFLWQQRKNSRLSGEDYRQQGGIAGMLSSQADTLLNRIDRAVPKGKQAALELLLRLTRIHEEGRHTRQRISRREAVFVAGNGNDPHGEKVLRLLSGEHPDTLNTGHYDVLRLITLSQEQEQEQEQYVDLIHETLIRPRSQDKKTGQGIGYWPTLYDYIEENRHRDIYRQQLKYETEQWQQSKGLGRVRRLNFFSLKKYRPLRVPADSPEGRFLTWSGRARRGLILLLTGIALFAAESVVWVQKHGLPLEMMWMQQRFRWGYKPLPNLVAIPAGSFTLGEQDADFIAKVGEENKKYLGVPGKPLQIEQPFYLSKTEVTYKQYDYYVWQQRQAGNEALAFLTTAEGGRGNRPVVHVTGFEAAAYATWLGERTGHACRLPTEAEWEYAARAGTQTAYPWGDELGNNNANCAGCGSPWDGQQSAPVGSFAANGFGLYDMSGNVWEWTCSVWRDQFDGQEQRCAETEDSARVVRGGSWDGPPDSARSATRYYYPPLGRSSILGFRVWCSSPIDE